MKKVTLICGKICSGKSWYAARLREQSPAVILSTDEVTWDLTRNEQGEGYDAFAARVNGYLRKKAAQIVQAGADVILDWGFWTRQDRETISRWLTEQGIPFEWHYIDISESLWKKNIAARNQRIEEGRGGSDFYVDEGLLNKLEGLFEAPCREEMDVWYVPDHEGRGEE